MKPVPAKEILAHHPDVPTFVLGEDQPQYEALPVAVVHNAYPGMHSFIACYKLSSEEIGELMTNGGKLWIAQGVPAHPKALYQPIYASVFEPYKPRPTFPPGEESGVPE